MKNRAKEMHPCFGAKTNRGRIHLPVSPVCNLECAFCSRKINRTENRPGVAATVITPQAAVEHVRRALVFCPEISVVGIAGPGDPLASDAAAETFKLVGKRFPHLLKCLSTNGLLLDERADELIALGLDTLTVTVNAVEPEIQTKINAGLVYHDGRYEGEEAARMLIRNQLAGIRKMAKAGILVKVNTVLINEINSAHIAHIAREVSEAGASLYNIIPLIPQHKLENCAEPTCMDLIAAREQAEKYIEVFRHCRHCRADAVGIPGQNDFADRIYAERFAFEETFSHG